MTLLHLLFQTRKYRYYIQENIDTIYLRNNVTAVNFIIVLETT